MKNVVVVHGCPSHPENDPEKRTYDKHWMPWLKKQLNNEGIKVEMPLMPKPWAPVYEDFKQQFEKYQVDEDTILIGHSCGCSFLVRWLGETKKKVAKLILVAPWKIASKEDVYRPAFYGFDIDESIKSRVNDITMFIADNETKEGKESLEIFQKALGGKVIELHGMGHFTLKDMGKEEFPELLKEC
jgi:predicted alpha/beta hydrolase family esterase